MHKFIVLPIIFLLTACSSSPGSQSVGKGIGGAMILGGIASLPDKDETDDDGEKLGRGLILGGVVVGYISTRFEERRKAEADRVNKLKQAEIDKMEKQKRDVMLAEKQRLAAIQREKDKLIKAQKEKERQALISTPLYKRKQEVLLKLTNLENNFKKVSQDNNAMLGKSRSPRRTQTECGKANTAYDDRLSAVIKLSDETVNKGLKYLSEAKSEVREAKDIATVNAINSRAPNFEKALKGIKEADKKSQLANAYLWSKELLKHKCLKSG